MNAWPHDELDLQKLVARSLISSFEQFDEVESTNSEALSDCSDVSELPRLIIADRQTAGRGRGGNSWWSGQGALTFTLIIDPDRWQIPRTTLPMLPLAVGLAVARTCEACLADRQQSIAGVGQPAAVEIQLKWPNDIYAANRKLGGILIESLRYHPQRFAIGIGLNVNNSLAEAPAEIRERAVSLIDFALGPVPRIDLLSHLLSELYTLFALLGREASSLLDEYRTRCWLTGRVVRVVGSADEVTGRCLGIDDTGALMLLTPAGPRRVLAGTVQLV